MVRETSIAVYRELEASGMLSRLRLLVAHDIAHNGPTTQAETTVRLRRLSGARAAYVDSYQPRFAELEEQGVIRSVEERVDQVTGNVCVAWELTGRMPSQREKKLTKVELERAACAKIARDLAASAKDLFARKMAEDIERLILGRSE